MNFQAKKESYASGGRSKKTIMGDVDSEIDLRKREADSEYLRR